MEISKRFIPSQNNTMNNHILKTESLDNAILELWLAKLSWYTIHYTMLSKYGTCTRLLKIENTELKIGCHLQIKSERIQDILWVFFLNKTIIPFALVGCETIIANSLISNAHYWNNC